ncbi:hypothetical protein HN51_012074, partial [Arachis hypogaea]
MIDSLPQLLSPKPSHPHQAHHSSFLLSLPIATPAAFHGLVDAAASYFLTVVVPCLVAVILCVLCSTLIASNLPLLMSNLG